MTGSRRQQVHRVEVATMVGSAIVGGALLPLGDTPARMSAFLFGWAGGCLLHLGTEWLRVHLPGRRRLR